jgi:predicted tellurium resistance membrane protein TerC
MAWMADVQIWAALLTLTAIEIVLGVDNLIMISVLANRLPRRLRSRGLYLGLAFALATRLALLAGIAWITRLGDAVFEAFGHAFSPRDIILIAGGAFLLYSATREIHANVEAPKPGRVQAPASASFGAIIAQVVVFDMVFSLDSIITAVGMTSELWIMAAAIIIAVAVMLAAARFLAAQINAHPTIKILVLGFLLLIGMTLVADGIGFHIPRGYIYAAISFSIAVEMLNQRAARRRSAASRVSS